MSNFVRTIRKFFVSAFVVFTFVAYIVHERLANPNEATSTAPPVPVAAIVRQAPTLPQATPTHLPSTPTQVKPTPTQTGAAPTATTPSASGQEVLIPTPTPQTPPTAQVASLYKDGTYTGNETDAVYGLVQVQVVIRNGQIVDVQFLNYPQDRRTSVRINSSAVPALQSEVIQAQSASVDIISGATLTSQAFIQSLQSALDAAKA